MRLGIRRGGVGGEGMEKTYWGPRGGLEHTRRVMGLMGVWLARGLGQPCQVCVAGKYKSGI